MRVHHPRHLLVRSEELGGADAASRPGHSRCAFVRCTLTYGSASSHRELPLPATVFELLSHPWLRARHGVASLMPSPSQMALEAYSLSDDAEADGEHHDAKPAPTQRADVQASRPCVRDADAKTDVSHHKPPRGVAPDAKARLLAHTHGTFYRTSSRRGRQTIEAGGHTDGWADSDGEGHGGAQHGALKRGIRFHTKTRTRMSRVGDAETARAAGDSELDPHPKESDGAPTASATTAKAKRRPTSSASRGYDRPTASTDARSRAAPLKRQPSQQRAHPARTVQRQVTADNLRQHAIDADLVADKSGVQLPVSAALSVTGRASAPAAPPDAHLLGSPARIKRRTSLQAYSEEAVQEEGLYDELDDLAAVHEHALVQPPKATHAVPGARALASAGRPSSIDMRPLRRIHSLRIAAAAMMERPAAHVRGASDATGAAAVAADGGVEDRRRLPHLSPRSLALGAASNWTNAPHGIAAGLTETAAGHAHSCQTRASPPSRDSGLHPPVRPEAMPRALAGEMGRGHTDAIDHGEHGHLIASAARRALTSHGEPWAPLPALPALPAMAPSARAELPSPPATAPPAATTAAERPIATRDASRAQTCRAVAEVHLPVTATLHRHAASTRNTSTARSTTPPLPHFAERTVYVATGIPRRHPVLSLHTERFAE